MKHPYLSVENRSNQLIAKINELYDKVNKDARTSADRSIWGTNGTPIYQMAIVPETYLLEQIIKSNVDKKIVTFADVGAGCFALVNTIANFINDRVSDGSLPSDIKVNVLGVRGEQYLLEAETVIGVCHVYKFGSFKIENFIEELQNRGLNEVIGKFDLITTRYTLEHLADPVGALVQLHDCLDNGGMMIYDNRMIKLDFVDKDLGLYGDCTIDVLLSQFHIAGDDLILKRSEQGAGLATVLKKHGNDKLRLPFNYIPDSVKHDSFGSKLIIDKPPLTIAVQLVEVVTDTKTMQNFVGDTSLFKEILSALTLQIKNDLAKTTDLTVFSSEYCQQDLINYTKFSGMKKPKDLLTLEEKYSVHRMEDFQKKLAHQLETIEKCEQGVGNDFEYANNSYSFIEGIFKEVDIPVIADIVEC